MRNLRIEKFYAFWGQDLDTTTTPLECGRACRVKFDVRKVHVTIISCFLMLVAVEEKSMTCGLCQWFSNHGSLATGGLRGSFRWSAGCSEMRVIFSLLLKSSL